VRNEHSGAVFPLEGAGRFKLEGDRVKEVLVARIVKGGGDTSY